MKQLCLSILRMLIPEKKGALFGEVNLSPKNSKTLNFKHILNATMKACWILSRYLY